MVSAAIRPMSTGWAPPADVVSSSSVIPSLTAAAEVGAAVGDAEGAVLGADVGELLGADVGEAEGWAEGLVVGEAEGEVLGAGVGEALGAAEGEVLGADVGDAVGCSVGLVVGEVGEVEGATLGETVVGAEEGLAVGDVAERHPRCYRGCINSWYNSLSSAECALGSPFVCVCVCTRATLLELL